MLSTLVGSPSVSSNDASLDQSNATVINHLANWLSEEDFSVEVFELPSDKKKLNLAAQKGSGEGGLTLAGHTDTVPTDVNLWDTDPFDLREHDGRAFGLGVCDMKGFFPSVLAAVTAINEKDLRKPITVIATADEESSMAGARYFLERGFPKSDATIIGEPTQMTPIFAHKGIMIVNATVQGVSGHSSDPEAGVSALDTMYILMERLMRFRSALRQSHSHDAFSVSYPTMNLGCLHAGDSPNRICSKARISFDVRLLPGMDSAACRQDIEEIINGVAEERSVVIEIDHNFEPILPYETSREGELVKFLEKESGNTASTVSFGTEAPFFSQLGAETVIFGSGSIDQAHQANEYLDLAHIPKTQKILEKTINRFCVAA